MKTMRKALLLLLPAVLLGMAEPAAAETGKGGSPGYFLGLGGGARALAMGGAFTAVADDASAVFWNPAGLATLKRKEVQLTHLQLFESTRYEFVSYAHPFSKWALGLGVGQLYSGGFVKTDGLNTTLGEFSDQYTSVFAGGGIEIKPDTLYFGFAAKAIDRKMDDYSGRGYGLDAGMLARLPDNILPFGVSAGVNVQNLMAPKIKRENLTDEFPLNIKAGAAVELFDGGVIISGDIENNKDLGTRPRFGAEWTLARKVALRAGYDQPAFTAGFGVKLGDFGLDYAFLNHEEKELGISHRLSAGFKFGRNRDRELKIEEYIKEGGEYLLAGQWKNAESSFQKAAGMDDKNKDARAGLVRTYLAWADDYLKGEKKDRREAMNLCEKALKIDPGNGEARKKIRGLDIFAVMDFTGKNVSGADASIITDIMRTELVNTGAFNILDRANMDAILAEQKFQNSGCTEQDCAAQIGKLLNVTKMLVGTMSKLLDSYHITVNLVDVQTGKILASYAAEAANSSGLREACRAMAGKLSAQ